MTLQYADMVTQYVATDFVIHCSSVNTSVRISSTPNEAYGIAEKYNIELQANECYESAAAPEPAAEHAGIGATTPGCGVYIPRHANYYY